VLITAKIAALTIETFGPGSRFRRSVLCCGLTIPIRDSGDRKDADRFSAFGTKSSVAFGESIWIFAVRKPLRNAGQKRRA